MSCKISLIEKCVFNILFLRRHINIIQKVLKFYLYVLTFTFIRMGIVDKDFKGGFQYPVKIVSYFFNVPFLETCKSHGHCLAGLNICQKLLVEFETSDLKVFCIEKIKRAEKDLLEALYIGICERLPTTEENFCAELQYLEKEQKSEYLNEWLVKLREIERITK